MYKKTWCTCKAVVLLINPIAFFDAQPLQKQAKQTGVSCYCGKHCWLTLCFAGRVFCVTSFGVCTHPKHQETTKQTKRNHNKNQEPCKSESFARRYFFPFLPQYGARSQATKLRMRPPKQSTKHFDNHFNPVSRAILKWRIGNLKKPPGFEQDWRFRFNLANSLWSGR